MSKKIQILSTKTLPSIQKSALENANFNVLETDFIKTQNKNFDLKDIHANLIFTSQNAAHSVLSHKNCDDLKTKNVFCVGLKTKILLSENGFNVNVYTGYAEDLAEIITLIHHTDSFTFFSGNLRRDMLPNSLKKANVVFNEIEVYETTLTPQKIKNSVDGILFFSPSGVESYLKENTIKNEICFCIGETTAETLENKKIKNIVMANSPSIQNVITEVIEYYS